MAKYKKKKIVKKKTIIKRKPVSTDHPAFPYKTITKRNAFGLKEAANGTMAEFPLDDNSNPGLEITGVHVLNRKRTLSMTGLDNEGERKNYQFRKFTNKATKYKPRWMEIDFEGKPLKNSKIAIDDLRMEKGKQGKPKLKSVRYRDYNDESPSLKRANWRGKQMSETIPPPAELVIVEPDTPKGIRIGVRTGNSELSKLFQATNKRKKGLVGRYGNKDIW